MALLFPLRFRSLFPILLDDTDTFRSAQQFLFVNAFRVRIWSSEPAAIWLQKYKIPL